MHYEATDGKRDMIFKTVECKDWGNIQPGLQLSCAICGAGLIRPSALVFGPPSNDGLCKKHHICTNCWPSLQQWMNSTFQISHDVK